MALTLKRLEIRKGFGQNKPKKKQQNKQRKTQGAVMGAVLIRGNSRIRPQSLAPVMESVERNKH